MANRGDGGNPHDTEQSGSRGLEEDEPCVPRPKSSVSSGLPNNGAEITVYQDLHRVYESFDNDHDGNPVYSHCGFLYIDKEHVAYFYMSKMAKLDVTLEAIKANLRRIPDEEIYPEVSAITTTFAGDIGPDMWLKNTFHTGYEASQGEDFLAKLCLGEALVYEILLRNHHPNIAKYHGCLVKRGRIIGLVLDRYPSSLTEKVKEAKEVADINTEAYMTAMRSGIQHLHSLGFAHNDLNPNNIMLDTSGNLVIIDFGSCRPFGSQLMTAGTAGWVDTDDENSIQSAARHDDFSLGKLEDWLTEKVSQLGNN